MNQHVDRPLAVASKVPSNRDGEAFAANRLHVLAPVPRDCLLTTCASNGTQVLNAASLEDGSSTSLPASRGSRGVVAYRSASC